MPKSDKYFYFVQYMVITTLVYLKMIGKALSVLVTPIAAHVPDTEV